MIFGTKGRFFECVGTNCILNCMVYSDEKLGHFANLFDQNKHWTCLRDSYLEEMPIIVLGV